MKNHSFCFNLIISNMFSQKCILESLIRPLTMCVLSPSIDKYLGLSTFVLSHTMFKSGEFGFLKLKQIKQVYKTLSTANFNVPICILYI